jgi:hypothetical protein
MKLLTQRRIIYASIVFMLASAIALETKNRSKHKEKIPQYSMYHKSTEAVSFYDWDGATNLRAFAEVGGKRLEMAPKLREESYAMFYLPKRALELGEATVWAKDPNDNKSKRKTIGILEQTANNQ